MTLPYCQSFSVIRNSLNLKLIFEVGLSFWTFILKIWCWEFFLIKMLQPWIELVIRNCWVIYITLDEIYRITQNCQVEDTWESCDYMTRDELKHSIHSLKVYTWRSKINMLLALLLFSIYRYQNQDPNISLLLNLLNAAYVKCWSGWLKHSVKYIYVSHRFLYLSGESCLEQIRWVGSVEEAIKTSM